MSHSEVRNRLTDEFAMLSDAGRRQPLSSGGATVQCRIKHSTSLILVGLRIDLGFTSTLGVGSGFGLASTMGLASTAALASTFGLVGALTAVFTGRDERVRLGAPATGGGTGAVALAVFREGCRAGVAAVAQSVRKAR